NTFAGHRRRITQQGIRQIRRDPLGHDVSIDACMCIGQYHATCTSLFHRPSNTANISFPMLTLPAVTSNKDQSLQQALQRMLAEFETGARTGVLTADDDPHVTAARRLAPVEAQFAEFPDGLDPRLMQALRSRGLDRLYIH